MPFDAHDSQPHRHATDDDDERRLLRCVFCKAPVTTSDQALDVAGRARHTFMNPDGVVFHLRLFRRAPGALCHGVPTTAYTWFPGTAWCFADCAACRMHLGWRYDDVDGEGGTFFGFVEERLVEVDGR